MFASVFLVTGCSSFQTEIGKPLNVPATSLIQGKTHVRTILNELGPPHAVGVLPNGFVFLYEYHLIREFQWGFSLKAFKLPYVKVIKADSDLAESARILTFDDKGILTGEGSGSWKEKLSGGAALQLIVSAINLTDTSTFRQPSEGISWGRRSLDSLPRLLNSRQDLTEGSHGVELTASPAFVGQSTLEMQRPGPLKQKSARGIR